MPINSFPGPDNTRFSGVGDIQLQLFFTPAKAGGLTWGVGPVFLLPTATEDTLGGEKWGLGPTGVALVQTGNWTYGALANHVWSVAGDDDRSDISQTFLQPFLSYTTPGATTYFLNTESTYDWEGEAWTVPINAGVNQLLTLGGQRIQIGGGLRYWVEARRRARGLGGQVQPGLPVPDRCIARRPQSGCEREDTCPPSVCAAARRPAAGGAEPRLQPPRLPDRGGRRLTPSHIPVPPRRAQCAEQRRKQWDCVEA